MFPEISPAHVHVLPCCMVQNTNSIVGLENYCKATRNVQNKETNATSD